MLSGMKFGKFTGNIRNMGMSLSEVVFATAILGIIIVTMIGTLTGGLEALQKSTNYNQASIIAQRTVEIYKATDYDSLGNVNITKNWAELGFDVTVDLICGNIGANTCKKLVVTVSNVNYEATKKAASVKLETLLIKK